MTGVQTCALPILEALKAGSMSTVTAREESRHTLTLRLRWLLMKHKLNLNFYARYSPSDEDVYLKPHVSYKINDRWKVSAGGNLFAGDRRHTFLGQFENNSNVWAGLRHSY